MSCLSLVFVHFCSVFIPPCFLCFSPPFLEFSLTNVSVSVFTWGASILCMMTKTKSLEDQLVCHNEEIKQSVKSINRREGKCCAMYGTACLTLQWWKVKSGEVDNNLAVNVDVQAAGCAILAKRQEYLVVVLAACMRTSRSTTYDYPTVWL